MSCIMALGQISRSIALDAPVGTDRVEDRTWHRDIT